MKTYIVLMDENKETEARSAAQFVNGQEFTNDETWSEPLDLVSDWLDYHHFSPNIAVKAVEATEYFEQYLQSDNVPSCGICAAITIQSPDTERGLDDLLHLLKHCVCAEDNFEVFVNGFTDSDLRWLYARNLHEVNCWLADTRTDLSDLPKTDRNIATVVTALWAKSVLKNHFKQHSCKHQFADWPTAL